MKQLPENIDDIEKFYQEAFENEFIEPSPLLWDKISTQLPGAASTATAPLVSGVKTFLGITAKTWLVTGVVSSSMGILGYLYFSDKNFQQKNGKEENVAPVEQVVTMDTLPLNDKTESNPSIDELPQKDKEVTNSAKIQESKPTNVPKSTSEEESISSQPEVKEVISSEVQPLETEDRKSETMEQLEPKLESTKGVEPTQQKVHSSFFEKKTQQLKDSARPLFVPKGKK